ncbi:MAG: DUF4254 domain-containing protein [Bacteroidota bacterium]
MISKHSRDIFNKAIQDYHINDHVDTLISNPYDEGSLDAILYQKIWIDTVQWHLEDIIRDPAIHPEEALKIKRRIDSSNQNRTDLVEQLDTYFVQQWNKVELKEGARMNTESLGWAIDRFAILALKIYHMREEANRKDAEETHRFKCAQKLTILEEQSNDLGSSIDHLIEDIKKGVRYTKVYHQMKMYNDPNLNPILYANKDKE